MKKYLTIERVLFLIVAVGLVILWQWESANRREAESLAEDAFNAKVEEYNRQLKEKDNALDSLKIRLSTIQDANEELADLYEATKGQVTIIKRENEKAHNIADTASVNYVRRYFTDELRQYNNR